MRILALLALATLLIPPGIGSASDSGEFASRLDSLVMATMEAERIPGVALVLVRDGEVELQRGYGLADIERGVRVDPERTRFRLGSISKALTALALTRLVDEGRLGLESPVAPLVGAGIAVDGFEDPVRVRHLLDHSGGFDQIGARRQVDDPAARPSLDAFLAAELHPLRPPGRVGVYDTYGITLAGRILEILGGEDYAAAMERLVFSPLGMDDTSVETPAPLRDRLAVGYGLEDGALTAQDYEWYVTLPASSIDATAADMGRLLTALLADGSNGHGRLLGPSMARRLQFEPLHPYAPDLAGFSYGFWEEERNGRRALQHGGVMRGYTTALHLVPEVGLGIFVACNRDLETGPPVRLPVKVMEALVERMLPPRSRPARPPVRIDTARFAGAWAGMVGCFRCPPGEGWPVDFLRVQALEPGRIRFRGRWRAIGAVDFERVEGPGRLRFLADGSDRIRWLVTGPESWVRMDEVLIEEVAGPGWERRPATPIEALVRMANEDWERAAPAYAELAEGHPENGRVRYYAGLCALQAGRPADARGHFARAAHLGQWRGWSLYYLAATHAAQGDADAAFQALERALGAGFGDPGLLRHEPWWERLREDPRYAAALGRLGG